MKRLKFIVSFSILTIIFALQQNLTYGEQLVFENTDYQKSDNIRVIAEGTQIQFDVKPQIINGRTLVPMRAIFEATGLMVDWDNSTRNAKGINADNSIIFTIDSNQAIVNNQVKSLDVPASIIDGRTMVPLRFLSENMGYNVVWVGDSNLILMSKKDVVEWRFGGYETIEPYRGYDVMYINGVETSKNRYNGKNYIEVIATVNGISITKPELDETLAIYKKMIESQYGEGAWDMEVSVGETMGSMYENGALLDNMILEILIIDEASKERITITGEDLQKELDNFKVNFQKDEEYQQFLTINGMTEEYLKEALRREYLINQYLAVKIENLQPTDEELETLFNYLKMNQKVRARHILVATEEEAKEAIGRLNKGEKFEDLAKDLSIDTASGANGGDLDYFSYTDMIQPFSEAAFSLGIGQISEPVKSDYGYHIIEVTGKTVDDKITVETEKSKLTEYYKSNEYNNLINELKSKAQIIIL